MKKILVLSGVVAALATGAFAADGATIYKKCVACHGPKAEKVFNNKVPALNTLAKDDVVAAIKGYKTGANKYGMGAMMKPIANPLSDDDINTVADYIQTLK
ncbi:c-type cytochrome [Campylobacter mucosalis]|uniref:Periplasmic monoheme cytochrome c553 n=1 Tax=Campylobacter mucosalis CCUG 21559 TaxID=1032067 RepID=A0A6G5QGV2_9BACT|nr:c-type cytochrome [Campylobacter mucosalis]QCD44881.1 periplasmic monoheme cytochrome c553 [Campylobacter mucosalis CCUG 21559]